MPRHEEHDDRTGGKHSERDEPVPSTMVPPNERQPRQSAQHGRKQDNDAVSEVLAITGQEEERDKPRGDCEGNSQDHRSTFSKRQLVGELSEPGVFGDIPQEAFAGGGVGYLCGATFQDCSCFGEVASRLV